MQDVAQLVLQVDARIATAQQALNQLARATQQSSDSMEGSLTKVYTAHNKLGIATNNSRIAQMELLHVVRGSADSYASGAGLAQIFAQHIASLAEAASFAGEGMGKFGSILAGPWGIALTAGVALLATLISKHKEAGDSVDALIDKMRQQAKQSAANDEASRIFAQTLDGLTEEIRKQEKALKDLDDGQRSAALHALGYAAGEIDRLQRIRDTTSELLNQAKAQLEVNRSLAIGPETKGQAPDPRLVAVNEEQHRIASLQADLATTDNLIARAQKDLADAHSHVLVELASEDPAAKISRHYDELIDQARRRAIAEGQVGEALYKQVEALKAQEAAEIKALQASKKGSGEFGKQVDFASAEAIAKSAGLTVTSGYRSEAKQAELYRTVRTPENPVARPGTSAHEGANGKWALDIAFAPGLTPEKLRKVYGDQGVSLSAIYKESGHFHIEGSRSHAASAEKSAAAAAQKQLTDDDAFARESAQLDAEILATRKQLSAGYDTQAKYQIDEIEAQKQEQLAGIQKQLDAKQITAAQAQILRADVADLATAKEEVVKHREYVENLQQLSETAKQRADAEIGNLKFADDMATTQAAHRKLQLQINDIVFQQKEAELERLKAIIESNKDFSTSRDLQQQAANIQTQINDIPRQKAQADKLTVRGTMNPLEAWAQTVPKTRDNVIQAMQDIEARGLDSLASSIADVVTGTKSLGAAFKDISHEIIGDIIQMTIKMLIFRAISSIIGASAGGGGGAGGAGYVPARASGGPVSAGAAYLVGEHRPELFVPSANGRIVPSVPTPSVAPAANSNAPIELVIVSAPSSDAWAQVEQISATHAGQAVKVSIDHTNNAIRRAKRPPIGH